MLARLQSNSCVFCNAFHGGNWKGKSAKNIFASKSVLCENHTNELDSDSTKKQRGFCYRHISPVLWIESGKTFVFSYSPDQSLINSFFFLFVLLFVRLLVLFLFWQFSNNLLLTTVSYNLCTIKYIFFGPLLSR